MTDPSIRVVSRLTRLFSLAVKLMKNKLNLLTFLLPLFEMEVSGGGSGDIGVSAPDPAVIAAADLSSAPPTETSAELPQTSVTGSEDETQQQAQEANPLEGLPSLDELKQQAANKIPYAAGLANVVEAYERVKAEHAPILEQYTPWKETIEKIGDPSQAQLAHELVGLLHSPVVENGVPKAGEFTTRPFLDKLESESPGAVDQLFSDLMTFAVPGEDGKPELLPRAMMRQWGLNPDRLDDYRNIDTLRASGVVTDADLSKIPEKYHTAFKSMTQDSREDLLDLLASKPLVAEETLRNAERALASERFEQEQRDREAKTEADNQAEFQQRVEAAVEQDITTEAQSIYDSIYQNLSSQFTFSSDAAVNDLELAKIMGVVANLQSPYPVYRNAALKALKAVGVEPKDFEETLNDLTTNREEYVKQAANRDNLRARTALSKANTARQQVLAKANDYVLRLAKASGERAATAATQTGQQLATATARFVPAGSGAQQGGNTNPYAQNPHSIGTPEYSAFIRKVDREMGLNNASGIS